MVKDFHWTVQGHEFGYSMRVLDDLGCDLILGCDWFNICSPVECDFPKRTITVQMDDKKLKLQGSASTNSMECSLISGPSLFHMIYSEYETEIDEVFVLYTQPILQDNESVLADLLMKYQDVFEEPTDLPPGRGIEHQIVLKPNSMPKHQFPYRTSHSHKNEIERIVQDVLDSR